MHAKQILRLCGSCFVVNAKKQKILPLLLIKIRETHHILGYMLFIYIFLGLFYVKTITVLIKHYWSTFSIKRFGYIKHLLDLLEIIHKKRLILFKTFEEDIFTGFTTFQATAVELPHLVLMCWHTSDFFVSLLADDSFL